VSGNPIFIYWYFHLPNFILAALMYTAIGRVVLTFVFDDDAPNFIWRFFKRLTDPVIKAVGYVTPRAVPPMIVLLFSIVWLFAARVALLALVSILGAAPTTGVTQ
jgi:YggT family protein